MNGQMRQYNLHSDSYLKLPEPIPQPDVKLDIQGIVNYAKERGLSVAELSMQEKEMFMR